MSTTETQTINSRSRRPADSAFKQQRLPAWQPILTAGTVLPTFFIVGITFIPIGIGLLYFSDGVGEKILDYTDCKSVDKPGKFCSEVVTSTTRDQTCKCSIDFSLDQPLEGTVYMYYGLKNFYQNHRRYVKSRDDRQLLGRLDGTLSDDCVPFKVDQNNKPIAPCGAIANSLFSDELTLKLIDSSSKSTDVLLLRTGIAWPSDKQIKFRNPPIPTNKTLKDVFAGYVKPPHWKKNIWELDTDPNNNGFQNEDLIVWMRTAALPNFRKLYRRIDHSQDGFKTGLPKGNYRLSIQYNYPVKEFEGSKQMILSTTSILGGKNPMMGYSYVVVGSICLILGVIFLIIHIKFGKSSADVINVNPHTSYQHVRHWCLRPPLLDLVQHKEGIVDSLPQSLLDGRPGGSLLLTPQQLQQLQQLTSAGEGGGVTVTLQHGQAGGIVLAPQQHAFYPEITHSILHHHVRQASIIQQVGQTSIHQQMGMGVGVAKPGSPSAPQRVVTPHQVMGAPPQVLQIFHQQATRNTVTGSGVNTIKSKPPPQILPKPPGSVNVSTSAKAPAMPQPSSSPQITIPTQQQPTILLNQMIPGGPMLVQQQTSSGLQLILRSPPPAPPPKQGTVVLSNGQQGTVLVHGRQQVQPQVVRLVSGQTLQLQQIQTSSGPAIIAVPTPSTPTPPPQPQPSHSPTLIKKAKKKKKKEDEPTRLDLANLMKLSGIEDEDMAPVSVGQQTQTPPQQSPAPSPAPAPPPPSPKQQPQLVAQLQPQQQCPPNQGLRVSVGEDGRMILHQNQPQVSGGVTPSIAAAAQNQLAQLLAHHGDGILQNNTGLAGAANKDSAALLQHIQTAVLNWANTDSLIMKSGGVSLAGAPQVMINAGVRRPANTPSVVVANPAILDSSQNGVRIVTDINGLQPAHAQSRIQVVPTGATVSLSEQNRVQIVNSLSEQQNRVQIVSNSLSEQQNRVQIVNSLSEQQNRVHIVSNSLSEQQNRVQIVTSVPHSQAMSFSEQNNRFHAIVSRAPSATMSLEQQNRVHIVSGVPTSTTVSLSEQLVSGSQMSTGVSLTDQQSRVQIVSGSLTEQQNRVQIVSGVPNSTLTEQQNRVQIVSSIPSSSSVALTEQNHVQIVSGVTNPSTMSLSEQNRVQIVSAVPQSSAMSLEQQNRVQIVSGVHSSGAMSMTEQQNRLQIVSGITNKAMALTEQQNRVQIISGVPTSMSLTEQQNRVQIVSGMQNSNSLSLEQQNRVQIVSGMPNNAAMSLAEQQNRVHIVSGLANSSMSCEQNRVQIVSGVTNSAGIQINEQPHNRVHVVSASTNTSEQPSRVQIVSGIPNRTAPSMSDRIHLMQNDQNRIMPNLPAFSDHQRVHIVSGTQSSNPMLQEQNRVQIVTGVPNTNILSLSEQQSRVQILSNSNHNSISLTPEQQRIQLVPGLSNEPTIQAASSISTPAGEQRVQIVNERIRLPIEPQRHSSGVQTMPQQQYQVSARSPQVYQQTVISPRCNPVMSPQSPRGGASKSPVVFPNHSPQQNQQPSPQQQPQTPKPTFSNRPNLTVVTQSSPSYQPQPLATSQTTQHIDTQGTYQYVSKPHLNNHPSVITSLASCQTTTAITKPLQAVTRQPPPPPRPPTTTTTTTTSSPASFQNAFLDSIAQSHPNLVINKSPTSPNVSKANLKLNKKLPKKSAVVKPMMHEERQGTQTSAPSCEKEPEPPSLVPISTQCDTPNMVQRVQTIQLTPQKQQHLKAVQSQITLLTNKKLRTPAENQALQRLFVEQQKILFSGKLIPTIPGQHAQGITFQVSSPLRLPPATVQSSPSPRQYPPPPAPPQPPPQPAPAPLPPPAPQTPTVSKATSPIHVQVGTQTSCEPSPSPPALSHTKRAALIEQQQRADRQGATGPDVNTPFAGTSDAVKRLVRYHCYDEPVFSETDLQKADEIFEATARHLLDKNTQMLNKYNYLLLMESMRQVQTSELIMLGRMFVSDETARLEAAKIEANAPPNATVKKERDDKVSVKKEIEERDHHHHHHHHVHEKAMKREREETDDGVSVKKHCADDEEINAQVQNAIDSILNLGNNRSDPALDEAVRSILTS